MPLSPNSRLGPYEVVRLLGAGGMGEVYRAKDTRLNRDVALKVLSAELAANAERLARFEREARAASALSHPAIVSVYDIGQADGHWYIAMELVEGGPLRAMLTDRPLPTRRLLELAVPIAQGLARAHRSGIVHRDLKPENVMAGPDGVVKIVDFGIAKLLGSVENADDATMTVKHQTAPGAVLGTVSYMSPEQTAGRQVDARTDQFSFGTMLVEMATGRHPFLRETVPQTQTAIIEHHPPSVRSSNPELPLPLAWIIERCLAKDPNERYGSTDDLARDLARVRDHLSDPGLVAASLPAPGRRSVPWAAIGAAILLAAAAASTAWMFRPQSTAASLPSHLALPLGGGLLFTNNLASDVEVSPDGRAVAFAAKRGVNASESLLFIRQLDREEAQLVGPGSNPFWSPDGEWLAFYDSNVLKKVRVGGGPVVEVAKGASMTGDWGTGDVIVFGAAVDRAVTGIRRVSAAGGIVDEVTMLNRNLGHTHHLAPQLLPGGLLLYTIRADGPRFQVAVQPLAGGASRILIEDASCARYIGDGLLLYQRGTTVLVATVDSHFQSVGPAVPLATDVLLWPFFATWSYRNGTFVYRSVDSTGRTLQWVDSRGTPEPIGAPSLGYANPRLSPSGRQIAAQIVEGSFTDAWVWDLGSERLQPITNDHQSRVPAWTADGSGLLIHRRASVSDIFRWPLDGRGAQQMTRVGTAAGVAFALEDGSFVYHQEDPVTGYDLWVMPAGQGEPRPLVKTPELEAGARLHPGGRWFAYTATRSGKDEVWLASWPDGLSHTRVSGDGSREPVWSNDGKQLFYRIGTKMLAVSFEDARPPVLGRPKELFDAKYFRAGGPGNTQYDVARDGRFLMLKEEENPRPYFILLQNWREKLLELVKR